MPILFFLNKNIKIKKLKKMDRVVLLYGLAKYTDFIR